MTALSKPHAHRLCPVWVGYLLACPIRRFLQDPRKILTPHVRPGMRVMDVGSAMGFFSLPLARLVGPGGRVVCVDVQEKMLERLRGRARRAGVVDRIETRVCEEESLPVAGLAGRIDFVLAFAVVHEVGDASRFFSEIRSVLKPGGRALFAEPKGHVREDAFRDSLAAAERQGLRQVEAPRIARSHAAVLETA